MEREDGLLGLPKLVERNEKNQLITELTIGEYDDHPVETSNGARPEVSDLRDDIKSSKTLKRTEA